MYVSLSNYCTFDHNFFVVVKEIFIKKENSPGRLDIWYKVGTSGKNTENSYIYFLTVKT